MSHANTFPKLHNAMWPGLVGKGEGSEPAIDLDTMLDLTAASVDGVKFDGVHVELSPDDKRAVVRGKQRLSQRALSWPYEHFLSPKATRCGNDALCNRVRAAIYRKAVVEGWLDPFGEPKQSLVDLPCASCTRDLIVTHRAAMTGMWRALPSAFDLPEWKTLRQLSAHEYDGED